MLNFYPLFNCIIIVIIYMKDDRTIELQSLRNALITTFEKFNWIIIIFPSCCLKSSKDFFKSGKEGTLK